MTAFDPQDWLDRWEAAGGGWHVRDGVPTLCVLQGAPITELMKQAQAIGRAGIIDAAILDRHARKEVWQPAE